jgi:hypothetical protein
MTDIDPRTIPADLARRLSEDIDLMDDPPLSLKRLWGYINIPTSEMEKDFPRTLGGPAGTVKVSPVPPSNLEPGRTEYPVTWVITVSALTPYEAAWLALEAQHPECIGLPAVAPRKFIVTTPAGPVVIDLTGDDMGPCDCCGEKLKAGEGDDRLCGRCAIQCDGGNSS